VRRSSLLLVPLFLAGAVVTIVVTRYTARPVEVGDVPSVTIEKAAVAWANFEVEQRPNSETYKSYWGPNEAYVVRGQDRFEYHTGIPVVNGTAFPSVGRGETVRWNLTGPLLINGRPVEPHPLQPRPLDATPMGLEWQIKNPSDAPRDSLSADWSRVGRVLVTAHGDGVARVWDVDKGTVRTHITPDAPTDGRKRWGLRAAVSPDGKVVATANVQTAAVALWDADTGKHLATLTDPPGSVSNLRFASDRFLLEARGDTLYLRDLGGDRKAVTALGHVGTDIPTAFAFGGGVLLRSDGQNHFTTELELPAAGPPRVGEPSRGSLAGDGEAVAVSRDGTHHATSGGEAPELSAPRLSQEVRPLWLRRRPDGKLPVVGAMSFFADGSTLAVGTEDSLRLYDVATGRERGYVATASIRSLAVSGDGAFLAASTEHGKAVLLWEVAKLQPR